MMPDRTTLLLACLIAAANVLHVSSVQQAFGLVYSVRALHSFRRTVRGQPTD